MYSETKFHLNPTKDIEFQQGPHCKIRRLWQRHVYRHDVAKVSDFNNGLRGFLKNIFYNFLFLAETYMICVNVFYVHVIRSEISAWSDKK